MTEKKRGRPTTNPKDTTLKFRFDQESLRKLNICSQTLHLTKSEVVRRGIHRLYQEVSSVFF